MCVCVSGGWILRAVQGRVCRPVQIQQTNFCKTTCWSHSLLKSQQNLKFIIPLCKASFQQSGEKNSQKSGLKTKIYQQNWADSWKAKISFIFISLVSLLAQDFQSFKANVNHFVTIWIQLTSFWCAQCKHCLGMELWHRPPFGEPAHLAVWPIF